MQTSRRPSAYSKTVTGITEFVNFKFLTVMPVIRVFPENSVPSRSTSTKRRLKHIKRIQVNHEFIASSSTTLDSELLQSLSFALFSKTEKYLDEKDKEQFKTIVLGSGVRNEQTSRSEKSQNKMPPSKRETVDQSEHTFVTTLECKESISGLTQKTDSKCKPPIVSSRNIPRASKSKDRPNKSNEGRKPFIGNNTKRKNNSDAEWANASLLLESVSQPFLALCKSQSQQVSDVSSELQFKSENKYDSCQNNFDLLADFLKKEDLRKRGFLQSNKKNSSSDDSSENRAELSTKQIQVESKTGDVRNEELSTKSRREHSLLNEFHGKSRQKTEKDSLGSRLRSYSNTNEEVFERQTPNHESKFAESARNGKCKEQCNLPKEARIKEKGSLSLRDSSNRSTELQPENERNSKKKQFSPVDPGLESKPERRNQTTKIALISDRMEDKPKDLHSLNEISKNSSLSEDLSTSTNSVGRENEKGTTDSSVDERISQQNDIKSHRTRLADSVKDLTMDRKGNMKGAKEREGRERSHRSNQKLDKKTLGQKISLFLHKKRAETETVDLIRPEMKNASDIGQNLPIDKNKLIVKPRKPDHSKLDDSVETIELVTRGKIVKNEHPMKHSFESRKTIAKDTNQSNTKLQSQRHNRKSSEYLRPSKKKAQLSSHRHNHRHRHHEHHSHNKRDRSKQRRKKENIFSILEAFKEEKPINAVETGLKSISTSADSLTNEREANYNLSNKEAENTADVLKNGKKKQELQGQQDEESLMQQDGRVAQIMSDSKKDRGKLLEHLNMAKENHRFPPKKGYTQTTQNVLPSNPKKQKVSDPYLKGIKSKRNLHEKSELLKIDRRGSTHNDGEKSNLRDLKHPKADTTKSKKEHLKDAKDEKRKFQKESRAAKKRIQNLEHLSAGGSFQTKKQTATEERHSVLDVQDCIVPDRIDDINCVLMYPYRSVSQTEIRVADYEIDSKKSFLTTNLTPQSKVLKDNAGFVTLKQSNDLHWGKEVNKKPSQFNTIAITSDNDSSQRKNLIFRNENITSDQISRNNMDQLLIASYIADEENEKPDEEIKVINYDSPKELSNVLEDSAQKKKSEKDKGRGVFKLSSPPARLSMKKKEKKKAQKRGRSQDIWNGFPSSKSNKKHWSDVGQIIDEKLKFLVSNSRNHDEKQVVLNTSELHAPIKSLKTMLEKQCDKSSKRLKYQSNDSFQSKTTAIDKEGEGPPRIHYVAAKDCSFQIKGLKLSSLNANSGKIVEKDSLPAGTSSSKEKIKQHELAKLHHPEESVTVASKVSKTLKGKKTEVKDDVVVDEFKETDKPIGEASISKRKTKAGGTSKYGNRLKKLSSEKINQKCMTHPRIEQRQNENDPAAGVSESSQQGKIAKLAIFERKDNVLSQSRLLQCRLSCSCLSHQPEFVEHSQALLKKTDPNVSSERQNAGSKKSSEDAKLPALGKSSLSVNKDGQKCTCVDWSKHPCLCSPCWPKAESMSKKGLTSQKKVSEPKHRGFVSSNFFLPTKKSISFQDSPSDDTWKNLEEVEEEISVSQRPMIDFGGQTDFSDSFGSDYVEGTYLPMKDSSSVSASISTKATKITGSTEEIKRTSKPTEGERMNLCENIGFSSSASIFNDTDPSDVNNKGIDSSDEDRDLDPVHCRHSRTRSFDETSTKYRTKEDRIGMVSSDEMCVGSQDVDQRCAECNLDLPPDLEERSFSKCSSSLKRSGKSLLSVSSKHQTYVAGKLLIGPSIDDAIIGTLQLFNQLRPTFPPLYSKPSSRINESVNSRSSNYEFDSVSDESAMTRVKSSNRKRTTHHASHSGKIIHKKAGMKNQRSCAK